MDKKYIEGKSTKELLEMWASMEVDIVEVEAAIQAQVLESGESVQADSAGAKLSNGKVAFDYTAIADELKIPVDVLIRHTKTTPTIGYKAACDEVGIPAALKAKHCKAAVKSVKIESTKGK